MKTVVATTGQDVVFDPQVAGGAVPTRAMAITDGDGRLATSGIATKLDLSQVTPSPLGAFAAGTSNSGMIDVAAYSQLFWYVEATGGAGGNTDFSLDWMDEDGLTVINSGPEHIGPFAGAGNSFKNVGPISGGGGYVVPTRIRIRTVVAAGASISGVKHILIGR